MYVNNNMLVDLNLSLIFIFQKIQDVFDKYHSYSENRKVVTVHEFANFLLTEQKDNAGKDQRKVSTFVCDFLKVLLLLIFTFICHLNLKCCRIHSAMFKIRFLPFPSFSIFCFQNRTIFGIHQKMRCIKT